MKTSGPSALDPGSQSLIQSDEIAGLLAAACDLCLVVDKDARILSLVPGENGPKLGDLKSRIGQPVRELLAPSSADVFEQVHAQLISGRDWTEAVQLDHLTPAMHHMQYRFHPLAGSKTYAMLGRDLGGMAETQSQLAQAHLALEQRYEAQRSFEYKCRILLSKTHDAVLFVDPTDGKIVDGSSAAADMLGTDMQSLGGASIETVLQLGTDSAVDSLIAEALTESASGVPASLRQSKEKVTIQSAMFRVGGGRLLYCALRQADIGIQGAGLHERRAAHLVQNSTDGILFVSADGKILTANDSFLDMVGAAQERSVIGQSLAKYLQRGRIDLGILLDNTSRVEHMRFFASKVVNDLGGTIQVELSTRRIDEPNGHVVGIIVRDVSRVDSVRAAAPANDSGSFGKSAADRVGTLPLKEIVAETTDDIEKQCIEAAVKMTRNNRVAAAEMLGLSRQSLYVKLRKYGLLTK